jgi:hypothetical protein
MINSKSEPQVIGNFTILCKPDPINWDNKVMTAKVLEDVRSKEIFVGVEPNIPKKEKMSFEFPLDSYDEEWK